MRFSCAILANHEVDKLVHLRSEFIEEEIKSLVQPDAVALVDSHRRSGDKLIIITATIEFITRPIADMFGIDTLIAPIPEFKRGRYTGKLSGVPSFGAGKVTRLNDWLEDNPCSLLGSYFYSDSSRCCKIYIT